MTAFVHLTLAKESHFGLEGVKSRGVLPLGLTRQHRYSTDMLLKCRSKMPGNDLPMWFPLLKVAGAVSHGSRC